MTRKLQFLFAALLLMVGVTSAWADDNTTSSVYCPLTEAYYDDVLSAFNAIKDNAASELEIQIVKSRPKLGTEANSRIAIPAGKTLTIKPMIDGIILTAGSHNRGNIWFLNAHDNSTFIIGDAAHNMTIEGYGFNDNQRQLNAVCANEKKGVMQLTNLTFSKFRFYIDGTKYGCIYANKVSAVSNTQSFVTMTDITITNSQTDNDAFINSVNTNNDAICLKGYFNIEHKEGRSEPAFKLMARMKLGDKTSNSIYDDFTASNVISIVWGGTKSIGAGPVVIKVPGSQFSKFDLTDSDYGFFRVSSSGDLKLTQAYTLSVSDARAATLVLPFEATFPSDAKCYTLHYTAGNDKVSATEVETSLAANTPVLVNAAEGKYKFVSTATSGDAATGSDPVTVGALTGVYADTYCPSASYILGKKDDVVGFYHPAGENTNYVRANRAYLTADVAGAREFLSIDFDGETTAVSEELRVKNEAFATAPYYNLSGQRIAKPTKGLYIVNGKKVVIK